MVTRQATRLYRDDQGVYRWVYYLDMYKNFSILRTLLKALGIGPGDAVFVPDFTFFATAEAVALEGATPVFDSA